MVLYTKIIHSDWLKLITGLGTFNQNELFQSRVMGLPPVVDDLKLLLEGF